MTAAWADFEAAEPVFAQRVRGLFTAHKHHTMATLRRDGSPRISGTEVRFEAGDIVVGMMHGARRAGDLRRDPRIALHTHTVDPPAAGEDQGTWCGDAKISGIARELPAGDDDPPAHHFRLEIEEVAHVRLGVPADHLVVESWRPGRGVERVERR